MAYAYRGTVRDIEEPELTATEAPPANHADAPVFDPDKCGTPTGYKQHRHFNEAACDPCKAALAAYSRAYRARVRAGQVVVLKEFSPEKCGTYAGYAAHKRHNVPPCAACLVAHADYMHAYRTKRKAA
jgi:hypothetical protein